MAQQQMGFAAAFLDPRMGRNARLEAIDAAIDWAPLEALAGQVRPGVIGGPPFPPLAMLKALYVQAPHDLSDPQPEARGLIIKHGTLIDATIVQAASRRPAAAPASSASAPIMPACCASPPSATCAVPPPLPVRQDTPTPSLPPQQHHPGGRSHPHTLELPAKTAAVTATPPRLRALQ